MVLTKFQLTVPRIVFDADGKSLYAKEYLNTRKWTYLREVVYKGDSTQQQSANYRIAIGVNKPRHVFVFILNDNNLETQTVNKFLYNIFSVVDDKKLISCHLEVGNGKEYPEFHYQPQEEPTRVFRDVLKYVHINSEYAHDTLLNRAKFTTIFPFIYFDLTKQPMDVKDGMTKLIFKYTLDGATNAPYTVNALVLKNRMLKLEILIIKRY